ncbi:MAG: hypothetical protein PHX40_04135 [Bacilli bacterium]|nr:hypothetical protein [Bacilli bacterium]
MAHTVYMPNGSMEVLFNLEEDFLKLVERHMGEDAGEIVSSMINNARYEEIKANSDMESYEASLDSNNTAFSDLLDEFEQMEEEIDAKRMNRTNILKLLENCKRIVNNQI